MKAIYGGCMKKRNLQLKGMRESSKETIGDVSEI